MTEGWHAKVLGDVCRVIGGGTPSKGNPEFYSGDIPWATVRDMRSDVIAQTEFKITEAAIASSATNIIPSGNVVISTRVGLGKVCLVDRDTAINQDLRGVIPINHNVLSVRFLYWWFRSVADMIVAAGTGATVQGVRLPFVKSLKIPLPSLPEQDRIVSILDEAFGCIATVRTNAERNLKNALGLFDSHLQSVFSQYGDGWVNATIGEHIRFIDYRGRTPRKTTNGLRLITAKNVKMGYLQTEPTEFVAPETYDEWMTRGIPRSGDVLFTTEAPLANVAQLDTHEKVVFAQRIVIMQPKHPGLDSTLLKYLLMSPPVQQRIHTKGTGATAKGIKASLLRTVEISFPVSLARQRGLVAELDGLWEESRRLASVYERKLAVLEEMKESILHRAFVGHLGTSTV